MTISEVIAEVNTRQPNAETEETKAKTLCTFEARLIYEFTGEEKEVKYPEYLNEKLILPDRYADVYINYLSAMMHFWKKEYEEYNNIVTVFSDFLQQYRGEHANNVTSERKRFYNLY